MDIKEHKELLIQIGGLLLGTSLVCAIVFLSYQVTERNEQIEELQGELEFYLEETTELQATLSQLSEEYDLQLEENEELGEEAQAAKEEAEENAAQASANAAEADRQAGIAWNAQAERDAIQKERDALEVDIQKMEQVATYMSYASDSFRDAMSLVAGAALAALDYDYDSMNYYVDLAEDAVATAEYYQNIALDIFDSI